ncbi:MAG: hypothetical protein QQW96_24415 [Tychonema bourrellyi B0820]|uniref:hypothetical protein n=1 Tax=Tychonema bourrellyi TaxID=54313 RepID=UPI0015D51A76|nr:hypothetical protein [Tychonema bourrellyi]MDQ2100776.1 hypothetical protein [Tychonema bourrellyi B0820]
MSQIDYFLNHLVFRFVGKYCSSCNATWKLFAIAHLNGHRDYATQRIRAIADNG